MSSSKEVAESEEKLSMTMKFIKETVSMNFNYEKSFKYQSSDDLYLCESRPFETRFPGFRLRWRVRYFRDTFQEPIEYSASLQLLSFQFESDPHSSCPELTKITTNCYLIPIVWATELLNVTFDLRDMQQLPISKNVHLEGDEIEKKLREEGSRELNIRLKMNIYAQFKPEDLTFTYKKGDFTTLPPISTFYEEDDKVSLPETFHIFDNITVRSYKFEKYANYESSDVLTLLQSRHFTITPFSDSQLIWRVRYFRDTFQVPYKHSVNLQLLSCVLSGEDQQIQLRVQCKLKLGGSILSEFTAEFNEPEMQTVPITKSTDLCTDKIEDALSAIKEKLRVGLVVYMSVYRRHIK